ncbi:PaaI family thioesterase [Nigerium massiliense]|uniref:PaaI family thioesterase n=1 Tax=Nigerium massiliense TaxID=1522317 RepID=UPI000693802C|nr:PaaI family thioesterase [Nigerium massiliense]
MSGFIDHIGIDGSGEHQTLRTDERHRNASGGVQGGVIATLMDTAMGRAVSEGLDEGRVAMTLQLSISYLNRAEVGDVLTGIGRVRKRSKEITFVDADVVNQDGVEVAHGTATFTSTQPR